LKRVTSLNSMPSFFPFLLTYHLPSPNEYSPVLPHGK